MKEIFEAWNKFLNEEQINEKKKRGLWANIHAKRKRGEAPAKPGDKDYPKTLNIDEENEDDDVYYVDAVSENEEYCPVCASDLEEEKKKPCKPSKGKRFAKRVDGKCRSFGQAGKAKDGGDRIRPGTAKADAYCARSAKIKKCKNPPCANTLSRKKWKCRGSKSVA